MWLIFLVQILGYFVVPGEAVTHVGCFSPAFVQQYDYYYKVPHTLPWEESVKICDKRLTCFLGVQIDTRSSVYNHVYCGNDLVQHSTKVNNSFCQPCPENANRFCGGDKAMSVYKLREATPLAVLLNTEIGVQVLIANSTDGYNSPSLIVNYSRPMSTGIVDYFYTKDEIIFTHSELLLRSKFNYITIANEPPVVIRSLSYNIKGLGNDYIQQISYWGNWDSEDLYSTDFSGTTISSNQLLDRTIPQQFIACDPYNRTVFFVERPNSLYLYSLESHSLYDIGKTTNYILAMALDNHKYLIFAIVQFETSGQPYLVSIDYLNNKMRTIYSGPELKGSLFLDVFQEDIVWLKEVNGTFTIFRCKLTPTCVTENLTSIYQTTTVTHSLKIYHPDKQTPGEKTLCSKLRCSHTCESVTLFKAKCTCPRGMVLYPVADFCEDLMEEITKTTTRETEDAMLKQLMTESPDLLLNTTYIKSSTPSQVPESDKSDKDKDFKIMDVVVLLCHFFAMGLLFIVIILLFKVYKSKNAEPRSPANELRQMCNIYSEPTPNTPTDFLVEFK